MSDASLRDLERAAAHELWERLERSTQEAAAEVLTDDHRSASIRPVVRLPG